ncbi:Mobile element protein [Candidatus Enterovibrio altilux]|uniref:Mobile element protein n=2 Tax=Candidatus Enterovibrio altilux TaxID=1927128 RepID=A0A291B6Y2_9GAMM|nr:Mobile element protein [Candidatus Enterovibrio luxaltus]
MVKRVFLISLRRLQRFINALFKFAQLPLSYPYYLCISKQIKMINFVLSTLISWDLTSITTKK